MLFLVYMLSSSVEQLAHQLQLTFRSREYMCNVTQIKTVTTLSLPSHDYGVVVNLHNYSIGIQSNIQPNLRLMGTFCCLISPSVVLQRCQSFSEGSNVLCTLQQPNTKMSNRKTKANLAYPWILCLQTFSYIIATELHNTITVFTLMQLHLDLLIIIVVQFVQYIIAS